MAEKWIQKAIKHKGALRSKLHVKEDQDIPAGKLEKAAKSKDKTLAKEARLAEVLKKLPRHTGPRKGK